MTSSVRRDGATSGDVLLALAAVALVAAMAYPRVERALMWRAVEAAQADVEAVRTAAVAYRDEAGGWPAPAEAGATPPELAGHLPPDFSFRAGSYTLEWGRWEAVEQAPQQEAAEQPAAEPPPGATPPALPPQGDSLPEVQLPVETLGVVTVHADDGRLLEALLERFGTNRSFLREGSWTLVLSLRGGG
jgi:hypothetical protein